MGLEWARRHRVRGLVLIAGGTHDLAPWWEPTLRRAMHLGGRHLLRHAIECPLPAEAEPYRSIASFHGYDFRRRPPPFHWQALPALIVSAGRDPFFSRAMAERLREQVPRARHLHLQGAGHLAMVQCAEEVNGALAGWIRDEGLDSLRSPQPGRR